MVETMSISTLNVRSIANEKKRKSRMQWLEKYHSGILLLQEKHAVDNLIDKWSKECKYTIYSSNGSRKSGGVATLIHKDLQHEVKDVY